MAALTVQDVTTAGIVPAFAAANVGGDSFENRDERVMLQVKNGGGGDCEVTIAATRNCNHGFSHDIIDIVSAGSEQSYGPFEKERFNTSTGDISVAYDQVTSVTVAVLRIPPA